MAVVLRFARYGAPKKPFYRIIASEKGTKRDSSFIEIVGTVNPMTKPSTVTMKIERVKYWLSMGAVPSDTVRDVIRKQIPNLIEEREQAKVKKTQTARKARKMRNAARTGGSVKGKAAKAAKADKKLSSKKSA